MNQLEIDIKTKTFSGTLSVLEDFQFTATSGEFVAVVGPSGAGKTTLLNIIAGIDCDYQGRVSTSSDTLKADEKLSIGFMFQQAGLMPWLTVLENIMLVIKNTHKSNARINESANKAQMAKHMARQVGLTGFENSYPYQLSGGMQKRVSLARAFAVDPKLLLLDEPFQSLDSPTANKFRDQLMRMWNSQKQTVIFVTHDLREAISMADRILFLSCRPSKILLDHRVSLSRPRTIDSESVENMHRSILSRYPDILSGEL